eukprot:5587301-Amphidinium_carterae.1
MPAPRSRETPTAESSATAASALFRSRSPLLISSLGGWCWTASGRRSQHLPGLTPSPALPLSPEQVYWLPTPSTFGLTFRPHSQPSWHGWEHS